MSKRVTEDNVVDAAGGSRPADVGGPRVSPPESPCVSKGMTEDNAADSMSDHICAELLKAAYLPRTPTECTDTAAAEPQYEETDSHYNDNEDEGRTQRQPLAAAPHPEGQRPLPSELGNSSVIALGKKKKHRYPYHRSWASAPSENYVSVAILGSHSIRFSPTGPTSQNSAAGPLMPTSRAGSSCEAYSEDVSETGECSQSEDSSIPLFVSDNDGRLGLATYWADGWLDNYNYIEFLQNLRAASRSNFWLADDIAELCQIRFFAPDDAE